MNIQIKNYDEKQFLPKFQEGGEMPAPEAAPAAAPAAPKAPQGGEDPMQQLAMACQQVLETQDCNLAMQVCQALLQMIGGGAPEAPAAPENQAPVFKKGGKFSRWINK